METCREDQSIDFVTTESFGCNPPRKGVEGFGFCLDVEASENSVDLYWRVSYVGSKEDYELVATLMVLIRQ